MKNLSVSSYTLVQLACAVFTLVVSIYYGGLYVEGDQYFYIAMYETLNGMDFVESFEYYSKQLNSSEVIHFIITWVGAQFFDKVLLFSVVNVALSYCFIKCCDKMNVNPWVCLLIFVSNFYMYVLFFAAERLKIGFLFGFAAFCVSNYKTQLSLMGLSVIGHAQMLIIYTIQFGAIAFDKMMKPTFFRKLKKNVFMYILAGALIVGIMLEHILYKVQYYLQDGDLSNLSKPIIFMLSCMVLSKQKKIIFFIFSCLAVTSFIIGDERVTIFSYFVFLFFTVQKRRGVNVFTFAFSAYFLMKSIDFLSKIEIYGQGFK